MAAAGVEPQPCFVVRPAGYRILQQIRRDPNDAGMQRWPVFPAIGSDADFGQLAAINRIDIRRADAGIDHQLVLPGDDAQDLFSGLGDAADKQIRQLSKGMAQTVQLLGTLVHDPDLIILDEPFSGLDALNQGKLERLIRAQADRGVTVIFSTHVIAHAERLCEEIAIIADGKIPFKGKVSAARDRLRPQVHLETRNLDGPWRAAIPADCKPLGHNWHFTLPASGVEPLLNALVEGDAGIESLSIERPGLHDAFVQIAGEAAARKMDADAADNNGEERA